MDKLKRKSFWGKSKTKLWRLNKKKKKKSVQTPLTINTSECDSVAKNINNTESDLSEVSYQDPHQNNKFSDSGVRDDSCHCCNDFFTTTSTANNSEYDCVRIKRL